MKCVILLNKPSETQSYGYLRGKCEIYKPAYSYDSIIISEPTFKEAFTNEIITFDENIRFIGKDPNLLEVTSELVLSGNPMFNTECKELISFNAWYTR